VPRRGGWRAWGAARADFERALTDAIDPAKVASEFRRSADYVRVAIAWDAFRSAARMTHRLEGGLRRS